MNVITFSNEFMITGDKCPKQARQQLIATKKTNNVLNQFEIQVAGVGFNLRNCDGKNDLPARPAVSLT